jgi:hypothetical protein
MCSSLGFQVRQVGLHRGNLVLHLRNLRVMRDSGSNHRRCTGNLRRREQGKTDRRGNRRCTKSLRSCGKVDPP